MRRNNFLKWQDAKRQNGGSEESQTQTLNQPDYGMSIEARMLRRIEQNIRRASSHYSELATGWPDESAENLVTLLLATYDKVKKENSELTEKIDKEIEAKLQTEEWAKAKEEQLEASNQRHLENLKASHQRQMEEAKIKSRYEMDTMKSRFLHQIETLENAHHTELDAFNHRLKNAEIDHRVRMEEEKLKFSCTERDLLEKHKNEMLSVKQENEDLKQALCSRDYIKSLSDRELTSQFKKLYTDIEDFSRIEWNTDLEMNWPYSEEQLRHLYPRNVRKLKQHIVQNCLWLALHEHVFQTPFRIIGEYGKAFDSRLYEANSPIYEFLNEDERKDYNFKRYENAKVFLAALDSSDPSIVNLHAIMQSYHYARERVLNLINDAIARVMTFEQNERKALDDILQSAARLWLDACSQRFRFFVIMPNQSEDVLRLRRGKISYLRLIIKPELWRFGNSRGDNLSKGELLAGWKSQIETFPLA